MTATSFQHCSICTPPLLLAVIYCTYGTLSNGRFLQEVLPQEQNVILPEQDLSDNVARLDFGPRTPKSTTGRHPIDFHVRWSRNIVEWADLEKIGASMTCVSANYAHSQKGRYKLKITGAGVYLSDFRLGTVLVIFYGYWEKHCGMSIELVPGVRLADKTLFLVVASRAYRYDRIVSILVQRISGEGIESVVQTPTVTPTATPRPTPMPIPSPCGFCDSSVICPTWYVCVKRKCQIAPHYDICVNSHECRGCPGLCVSGKCTPITNDRS